MMSLTDRDSEILVSLSRKIRLLSLDQIADHWWHDCGGPEVAAKRSLKRLVKSGLLKPYRILARPLPPLEEPVVTWEPGEARPRPGAVSWKLQHRWTAPPQYCPVYLASRRAKHLFGGAGNSFLSRPIQATHDLGMSRVYLTFLKNRPADAKAWLGEDVQTAGNRSKNPDAQLFAPDGKVMRVIEFGGYYAPKRVSSFHHHCVVRALPYEIW